MNATVGTDCSIQQGSTQSGTSSDATPCVFREVASYRPLDYAILLILASDVNAHRTEDHGELRAVRNFERGEVASVCA